MIDTGDIDVFLGLDVGKGELHAHRRHPTGRKTFDKRLPNTEPKLRELFAKLQAKHEVVLVVVDQPGSIGALPLAVARNMGCPGRISAGADDATDRRPGEAKTDARDAFIIADAVRTMPHTGQSAEPGISRQSVHLPRSESTTSQQAPRSHAWQSRIA
ncbi:IS110 family transposase [Streptomyces turgidiscabies]|uniref:IS110 family transposase n=1 Tax=Streptomyces turgidiscabies TaxID=85558 RepID=UPI0038F81A9B